VKWFEEQAVNLINQNRFDVTPQFKDPQSSGKALKPNATFNKPKNFDKSLNDVRRMLNIQLK